MKLLIIGFDALDYEYVLEQKILKDFQVIEMTAPEPLTGPGWTTLYTGLSMQEHGITSVHGVFETSQSKCFLSCKAKYLWDYLNEKKRSVELFALPVTYPPREVEKYMISGGVIPSPNFTCPCWLELKEYYTDIWDWFFKNKLLENKEANIRKKFVRKFQGKERKAPGCGLDGVYGAINRGIIKNFLALHDKRVSLSFVCFCFLDRIGHWSAFNFEQRKFWYQRVELYSQRIMQDFPGYEVMIISDHGAPVDKKPTKHRDCGVFAYKGSRKLKVEKCIQYDFLPTVLDGFGIRNDLKGKILW